LAKAQLKENKRRESRIIYSLLPQMRFPLAVPVWREAQFSAMLGISLPPYLKEGERDAVLALHLARYGDVEAAQKLADPADAALGGQIEACRYEQNYPAEWTR